MSTGDIQWLIGVLTPLGIGIVAAGIVLFAFVKLFLPAYLSEKGKNLATSEDSARILEQVGKTARLAESIKVELLNQHWLNQQQWSIRERCYADLLTNLTILKLSLSDQSDYFMEPGSEHDGSIDENESFRNLSRRAAAALGKIREQIGPVSIFLSESTIKSLESLISTHWGIAMDSVCTAEYVSEFHDSAERAYSVVLSEARNELRTDQKRT